MEEAYTTENWLVRIYKVVKPANRPAIKYKDRQVKARRTNGKKARERGRGIVEER